MGIKQNPVAWMTALVAALTAAAGVLDGTGVLSPTVSGYAGAGIAILTAILGGIAHGKVTPVSNPHDDGGRPLVPLSK